MIIKISTFASHLRRQLGKYDHQDKKRRRIPKVIRTDKATTILSRLPNWFFSIVIKVLLEVIIYRIIIAIQEGGAINIPGIRSRFKQKGHTMSGTYCVNGVQTAPEYAQLGDIYLDIKTNKSKYMPLRKLKRRCFKNRVNPSYNRDNMSFSSYAYRKIEKQKHVKLTLFYYLMKKHTIKSIIFNLKSKRAKEMGVRLYHKGREYKYYEDLSIFFEFNVPSNQHLKDMMARSKAEFGDSAYVKTRFDEADWKLVDKHTNYSKLHNKVNSKISNPRRS